MKASYRRKGFTLVELLIVIVVIGVLSTMMMLSSTEAVTSAKASNIVANLTTLKKATLAWYMDNLDKVQEDGRVKIGNETHPIQEWNDSYIHLSDYLGHVGDTGINSNTKYSFTNSEGNKQTNTDLKEGFYGVCDGGGIAGKRHIWYVGYRFQANESAVREKIANRLQSAGLMFGTADAHPDKDGDNAAAVWLQVLNLK